MRNFHMLFARKIINHGKILFDGNLSALIKKHAPYKLITMSLKEQVDRKKFEKLGKIKKFVHPEVILKVSSDRSNKVAAEILQNFPVHDLNIEDADIEDVIRDIFSSEKFKV